jgi:3'-phosphoadenosine 5'-phosphosulfate sulfotransferase (PAPS reductase)/FAD synthetase
MPSIYLTDDVRAFVARNPALVINISGGKDSQAFANELMRLYGDQHEVHFIFADTGWEQRDTVKWLAAYRWCQLIARSYGHELNIVYPLRSLLDDILRRGKWPDAHNRYCTAHAKRGPIQKWIRANITNPYIINAKGMRADESDTRKNMLPWEPDDDLTVSRARLTKAPRTVFTWLPIHQWTRDDVLTYLAANNIQLHPTYGFLDRFSCRVCIFNSDRDLAAIQEHDPDAFATVLAMEKAMGHTIRQGKTVEQRVEAYRARLANPEQHRAPTRRKPAREERQMCLW